MEFDPAGPLGSAAAMLIRVAGVPYSEGHPDLDVDPILGPEVEPPEAEIRSVGISISPRR
jgi:hypothetical protein